MEQHNKAATRSSDPAAAEARRLGGGGWTDAADWTHHTRCSCRGTRRPRCCWWAAPRGPLSWAGAPRQATCPLCRTSTRRKSPCCTPQSGHNNNSNKMEAGGPLHQAKKEGYCVTALKRTAREGKGGQPCKLLTAYKRTNKNTALEARARELWSKSPSSGAGRRMAKEKRGF